MPVATMTTKGQVTVPAEVRERLGLRAGSRVSFVETSSGSYELQVERASIQDLKGLLRWDGPAKTLDDMDEGVAAGAAEAMGGS